MLENGGIPDSAAGFLPTRSDFAQLWHALSSRGGSVSAPTDRFFLVLNPFRREETVAICLKVFEELGLVSLSRTDDTLSVRCLPSEGKTDLERSALLTRLRNAAQA